jgi:hypothetical protein
LDAATRATEGGEMTDTKQSDNFIRNTKIRADDLKEIDKKARQLQACLYHFLVDHWDKNFNEICISYEELKRHLPKNLRLTIYGLHDRVFLYSLKVLSGHLHQRGGLFRKVEWHGFDTKENGHIPRSKQVVFHISDIFKANQGTTI